MTLAFAFETPGLAAPALALWRTLVVLLFVVAALGAGRSLLRLARVDGPGAASGASTLLFACSLGWGVLAYAMLAIGLAGALYPPVIWALLWGFAIVGAWSVGRLLRGPSETPWAFREVMHALRNRLTWPYWLLLSALVGMVALNFLGALAPPLGPDDLSYHLSVPRRYVAEHRIHFIPDKYYSNLPFTMEMLWTAAIAIDAGELAQLLNWVMGLLILGWIALLGRRAGLDLRHVVIAMMLFYSTSTVIRDSRAAGTEVGGTLFVLTSIFALLEWRAHGRLAWLVLAGVTAGLYAGTKLPHVAAVALLAGWVLLTALRRPLRVHTGVVPALTFAFAALSVVGVWYLKAWVMTGNPIYPFLPSLFGGPPMRAELLAPEARNISDLWLASLRQENALWKLIVQPYRVVMDPQYLRGYVSPVFIAALPVVLWRALRASAEMRALLVFAGLLYLYWAPTYFIVRIGLPVFALLSLPVAQGALTLAAGARPAARTVGGALALWVGVSLAINVRETAPVLATVAGFESTDEYLLRRGAAKFNFSVYDAYLFMNRELPRDALVLLWESRGYYLDRPYIHALEFIQTLADPARIYDPEAVVGELRRFGITHVAMRGNYLRSRLLHTLEASRELECLYEGRVMAVCALPPQTTAPVVGPAATLSHDR